MTIASTVEYIKVRHLRPGEREALRLRRRRPGPDVKVSVGYFDDPKAMLQLRVHQESCNWVTEEILPGQCTCLPAEFGFHGTLRVHLGDLLLWRFVPRPLTLADAVRYEEVDRGLALVLADMMQERGQVEGFAIAKALKETAP